MDPRLSHGRRPEQHIGLESKAADLECGMHLSCLSLFLITSFSLPSPFLLRLLSLGPPLLVSFFSRSDLFVSGLVVAHATIRTLLTPGAIFAQ